MRNSSIYVDIIYIDITPDVENCDMQNILFYIERG